MIDFERVNSAALSHMESLLPELLPGGRISGREYQNNLSLACLSASVTARFLGPGPSPR